MAGWAHARASKQAWNALGAPEGLAAAATQFGSTGLSLSHPRTRLEVCVHQLQLVHERHALQQLPRKGLGLRAGEARGRRSGVPQRTRQPPLAALPRASLRP